MDVVIAPVTATPDLRAGRSAYCAARYRSFDPYSGMYLAADGNRYFCRQNHVASRPRAGETLTAPAQLLLL